MVNDEEPDFAVQTVDEEMIFYDDFQDQSDPHPPNSPKTSKGKNNGNDPSDQVKVKTIFLVDPYFLEEFVEAIDMLAYQSFDQEDGCL